MNFKKPLIGIIPDYQDGSANNYSTKSFFAIRTTSVDATMRVGGVPIILPYDHSAIDQYLSLIDGLIVIGGDFDIHPSRYNESTIHQATKLNLKRSDFEFAFVTKALENKEFPILGICNGMQLISVIYGGKLIQHIPDLSKYVIHEQSKVEGFSDYTKPYHDVEIVKNSQLYDIIKQDKISTNSSHHQGVESVGDELKIVARAHDQMIEAVEKPTHSFCLGVQWHPELNSSPCDIKIFEAFINQSLKFSQTKK